MKRMNTSLILSSLFLLKIEGGLSEKNNGPSIVSVSLMIENLARSPNCVLMLLKLAMSFSIKLVSLTCFCFSCKLQQSAFVRVAFWRVYFPRTKPSIEIVSGQIKINVSILRDPCRRKEPLLPSIFLLQNRSIIIAANQMKNLDAVMSYTGSAFLQKEIVLSPFRVVILMTAPCLPRDSPDEWIMRRSVTRIVSPSRPPTFASWFPIFIFSMFKDVRANCFCASLLRTEIYLPRHASSGVLKWTLISQMAIAIALFGFNDLGR